MAFDLDKIEQLNSERTKNEWYVDEEYGNIYADDEFVGDIDFNFADEEFILELVNSADELIRLAKLGLAAEKK